LHIFFKTEKEKNLKRFCKTLPARLFDIFIDSLLSAKQQFYIFDLLFIHGVKFESLKMKNIG